MNEKKITGRERAMVVAYFYSDFTSKLAIEKLKTQGFKQDEIKMEVHDAPARVTRDKTARKMEVTQKVFSFAMVGIVFGGIIGWLVGAGFFKTAPSTLVHSGPFLLAISGLIIGGFVMGLVGAMFGMRGAQLRPKEKEVILKIVCLDTDWANRAKKLLEVAGAHQINSVHEDPTATV